MAEHINEAIVARIRARDRRRIDDRLARARILVGIDCRRVVLDTVTRDDAAVLELDDAVAVRHALIAMQRPDAVVAVCVDMGRSIIDLRERADRQDFDVLLLDLARAVARKVIDCKIVACVLERVGHGLARPCVLIVIGCRIRVDFERILDVNRLRSDTNRGAREIVLERIRGALPVVLDRTRTIVGFRRTCGIKGRSDPVGRMIRIDRERVDASLRVVDGVTLAAVRHTIVLCRIVARCEIAQCIVKAGVLHCLIQHIAVHIAADIGIRIPVRVEVLSLHLVQCPTVERQGLTANEPAERDITCSEVVDRCRTVVVFFLACDIDRQRLLIDISSLARHRMRGIVSRDRVVGKCRCIARKRQRVVHRTLCLCGCACLCLCLGLCRGILIAVRPRDGELDLILIPLDNMRQVIPCHRIHIVTVVLVKCRLPVVLLDEMLRQERCEVTLCDRIARMVDRTVARAVELKVPRVDRDMIVNAVRTRHIFTVVLCTVQADIVKVDRRGISAAEIQRTVPEVLLDMRHIGVVPATLRPYDILCPIVHLRSGVDIKVEVIRRDHALADRSLAIGSIRDLIVGRIGLRCKRARKVRILDILAVRDHIAVRICDDIRIALEARIRRSRTIIAHDAGRIKRRTCDPIRRKRGCTASIGIARSHRGDVLRGVVRRCVIHLIHIAEPKHDLALCDGPRCTREIKARFGVCRRTVVRKGIVLSLRTANLYVVCNVLVDTGILIRNTRIHIVRRDRHRRAVIDRSAVRRAYELVVIRRAGCIGNIALCIVVNELVVVPRIRIHEICIGIVDLVDARFLSKVKRQHTAVNRALCRLGKVIAPRNIDVSVAQTEFIRNRRRCAVRRVRTAVLRPRRIHFEIVAQINPVAVQLYTCARDIVLHIVRRTRTVVLHLLRAVIGLRRIGCEEIHVRSIDIRPVDRACAVAVRGKLVVVRTKRRTHRRTEARILNRLVRARIRVGGKGTIRRAGAVLTSDARQPREIRSADIGGAIAPQHRCIGSRNRRRNRRIRWRSVIGLRHMCKGDIHLALCDRIVIGRDRRRNRCAVVLQIVVARICRVELDVIVDRLARTRILICVYRRRLVRRAVAGDQPRHADDVIRRIDDRIRGVLCRAEHIGRRVIDLRERALDRDRDILLRDGAVARFGKRRCPTEREIPARARIAQVVRHAVGGSAVIDILRIVFGGVHL